MPNRQPLKVKGRPILPPDRKGNDNTRAMEAAKFIRDYCGRRKCADGCVFVVTGEWGQPLCKLMTDIHPPEEWNLEPGWE